VGAAWNEPLADGLDRAAERALLGLERVDEGQATFTLTQPIARFDGKLFGGTAIAVAIALAEAETGRPSVWSTVQFTSGDTTLGDRFDCTTEVLAEGQSASQVRVTARVGGREIFCALGATARPKRGRPADTFLRFPSVVPLEESPILDLPLPRRLREAGSTLRRTIELRSARPLGEPDPGAPRMLWTRVPGLAATPAVQAYLADLVPVSIAWASGRTGGGTSIDNTMRTGAASESEWVLVEMHPAQMGGGYGHGSVHLWTPDGQLLGTASQSAALILFD